MKASLLLKAFEKHLKGEGLVTRGYLYYAEGFMEKHIPGSIMPALEDEIFQKPYTAQKLGAFIKFLDKIKYNGHPFEYDIDPPKAKDYDLIKEYFTAVNRTYLPGRINPMLKAVEKGNVDEELAEMPRKFVLEVIKFIKWALAEGKEFKVPYDYQALLVRIDDTAKKEKPEYSATAVRNTVKAGKNIRDIVLVEIILLGDCSITGVAMMKGGELMDWAIRNNNELVKDYVNEHCKFRKLPVGLGNKHEITKRMKDFWESMGFSEDISMKDWKAFTRLD